jgi:hypothetical protein
MVKIGYNTDGYGHTKTKYIYKGKNPVFIEIAESDKDVVLEHEISCINWGLRDPGSQHGAFARLHHFQGEAAAPPIL